MSQWGHNFVDGGDDDDIGDKEQRFTSVKLQESVFAIPQKYRAIAPRPSALYSSPYAPVPSSASPYGSPALYTPQPMTSHAPQGLDVPNTFQPTFNVPLSGSESESESESGSDSSSEEESEEDSGEEEGEESNEDDDERQPELGLNFDIPLFFKRPAKPKKVGKKNRGGGKRFGPRRAVEPTGDIKLRLTHASRAFMAQDYVGAIDIIQDIVKINAETHEAWVMLATCWEELGETQNAIHSYLGAAQLRPKHATGWLDVAQRFEEYGDIYGADYCYRCCTRFLPRCEEGHRGRARMNIKKRNFLGAITEFTKVLKTKPHDLEVLRGLIEAYVALKKYQEAKDLLQGMFAYYKRPNNWGELMPDWNDLIQLITVYQMLGDHNTAIKDLKSHARWFLDRADDTYFDDVFNDCEWDADADDERRLEIPGFTKVISQNPVYGDALPMKLRVQLGQCRFRKGDRDEGLRHFDWLDPSDKTGTSKVNDYSELYFEVAQQLFKADFHQRALAFYNPLRRIPEEENALLYLQIARCFRATKVAFKAVQFFQKTFEFDKHNIEARVELSEILMEQGDKEKAERYILEADRLRKGPPRAPRMRRRGMKKDLQVSNVAAATARLKRTYKPRAFRLPQSSLQEQKQEQEDEDAIAQEHYETFVEDREAMRSGDIEAVTRWREAAYQLTSDFRSVRPFYPALGLGSDLPEGHSTAMAYKMAQNQIPFKWRGIKFDDWLDIFLEYALFLARSGDKAESYDIMAAAKDSSVFARSREDSFVIMVVWCVCALFAADETACYFVSKSFMKDYQFTTDAYRLFTAVSAMCHSPLSWYMGGPSKKYIRRQIIQMDQLVNSSTGPNGEFTDESLDIPLMMLYGHIMYSSESYDLALDYFRRAHALDPTNAMISLSISLTYIHMVLNRRTQDQPHILLQGTSFLFQYYNLRKQSLHTEERQEAHFNVARAYHLLGLTTEASPYYQKVLEEAIEAEARGEVLLGDHAVDAAYNLRLIYMSVGNLELAVAVGERWMVV